ncbi:MAG: hypothetical protein LBK23_09410 [Oscillospiraceae bacterium]|jgi:hypothetical protein|nr:hypothetical protein [Oscillospiraceae bacterium]
MTGKNRALFGAILLIALLIFNIVVFSLPHGGGPAFWTGYGFTTAAFLLQILFVFLAFRNADSMKKVFLGLPLLYVGIAYLALQLVFGLICIFVPVISKSVSLAVSAVLLGLYLIRAILAVIGKEAIQGADDKTATATAFIKSLLANAEILRGGTDDPELRASLNTVVETIRYSDPMSCDALNVIEQQIQTQFAELKNAVAAGDKADALNLCGAIHRLLAERSVKCKSLK